MVYEKAFHKFQSWWHYDYPRPTTLEIEYQISTLGQGRNDITNIQQLLHVACSYISLEFNWGWFSFINKGMNIPQPWDYWLCSFINVDTAR